MKLEGRGGKNKYQSGRKFENEIVNKIKELYPDAIVRRTPGSKGFFDVFAIIPSAFDPNKGELHLIQGKKHQGKNPTSTHVKEWEAMKKRKLPKVLVIKKEFWIKGKGGNIIGWGEKPE